MEALDGEANGIPVHSVAGVGGETLLGKTRRSLLPMPFRVTEWISVSGTFTVKDFV